MGARRYTGQHTREVLTGMQDPRLTARENSPVWRRAGSVSLHPDVTVDLAGPTSAELEDLEVNHPPNIAEDVGSYDTYL